MSHHQKHLKDLLLEDQEPFHLPNDAADRSGQNNKKPNPVHKKDSFNKNPCFFFSSSSSSYLSPDIMINSPLVRRRSPNTIFFHVPAKTAALLLEAAMRIHTQQKQQQKPRTRIRNLGCLKGIFKRLLWRSRNRSQSRGLIDGDNSGALDEVGIANFEREEEENVSSPFRFALESCGGDLMDCASPCFVSPTTSPACRKLQGNSFGVKENAVNFQAAAEGEEKEQNSPVSVLDPPHDDNDDRHDGKDYEENHEEDNGNDHDLQCGYAFVQRSKNKILHKLHRFEKLAELSPFELEERVLVQEEEEGEPNIDESTEPEETLLGHVFHQLLRYQELQKPGMKRLITHLIHEDEEYQRSINHSCHSAEAVVKRVCKRLETWQNVEPSTSKLAIKELGGEPGNWRKPLEQTTQTATEIEVEIFFILVEEMVEDLI